jgi:hypothetical protein
MELSRPVVIACALLLLAGIRSACAQNDLFIEFTTTFPFAVGNTTLPAGTYTVRADDEDPQVLEVSGPQAAVFLNTESAQPRQAPSRTELVFDRYGEGYVLKNVWVEGSEIGYRTQPSLREQRLAKNGSPSEEHVIRAEKADTPKEPSPKNEAPSSAAARKQGNKWFHLRWWN